MGHRTPTVSIDDLRPEAGHAVVQPPGSWWPSVGELIGRDLEDLLGDDVDTLVDEDRALVVVAGPCRLDGDTDSRALGLAQKGTEEVIGTESMTVVVLGDLTVTGHFSLHQYAHLVVTGSLRARSVRSASANAVVLGEVAADEIIFWEESSEGGLMVASRLPAPLVARLDSAFDIDIKIDGDGAMGRIDEENAALSTAVAALSRGQVARTPTRLFQDLSDLVRANRAQEVVETYRHLRHGGALRTPLPKAAPGEVVLVCGGFGGPRHELLCGLSISGERILAAGGLGTNFAMMSTDNGRTFKTLPVDVGTGLRSFCVDGDTLWVTGERGMVARSDDGGRTFERVETGATTQANTLLKTNDIFWLSSDSGLFRSKDHGRSWTKVKIAGEVARPKVSQHGLLIPSSEGALYIGNIETGRTRKTSLSAGQSMWAATETNRGTVIVVGNAGTIFRSDDAGRSFTPIESGVTTSLENTACTAGGLLVVVGQGGVILRSTDDGRSFQPVPQTFSQDWWFGAVPWGEQVLVAGRQIVAVG